MTTTLVTGGAGFIGSHVVEHLLATGQNVIALDDLSSGKLNNLNHLAKDERLDVLVGSVLNEAQLSSLVKRADRVIHLSAPVGVRLLIDDPIRVAQETLSGTIAVLQACNEARRPLFITSSSEVYGKSQQLPFREDQDLVFGPPDRSRWSYGKAKAMAEVLGQAYARQHQLPVVMGRIFNTSGPRQSGTYGMVIPRFVDQAIRGEPITIYGDGSQARCFCHVADTARAIVALMESPAINGEVVNIGSDRMATIKELAWLVREMTKSHSEVVHVEFEAAYEHGFEDMQARQPDLTKIRRLINFEPARDLTAIVADVIAHQRASLAEQSEPEAV